MAGRPHLSCREIPPVLEPLVPLYERELSALRGLAAEFADRHPRAARRLQIDRNHCDDPQVERLLEAFAWVGARIQLRLEDELPELAEPLLRMLAPRFTQPIPSATILQLRLAPNRAGGGARTTIPRHAQALSPPVQGIRCPFRTCHPVELWPVSVAWAGLESVQGAPALGLELLVDPPVPWTALRLDRLRFFLDGDPALTGLLYELLGFRAQAVRIGNGAAPASWCTLPDGCLAPAGFDASEALFDSGPLPMPQGCRLLLEYFAFPDKFRFLELSGLGNPGLGHLGPRVHLQVLLGPAIPVNTRVLAGVSAGTFKLGCVPAVNLFSLAADPIPWPGEPPPRPGSGYPVTVSGRRPWEYTIQDIDSVRLGGAEAAPDPGIELPRCFSLQHGARSRGLPGAWEVLPAADPGSPGAVAIALADPESLSCPADFRNERSVLLPLVTCSNRNLPETLAWDDAGGEREAFLLAGYATQAQARPLRRPTPSLPPPARSGALWAWVALVSMNHLALARLDRDSLRQLLELHPGAGSPAMARQIQAIRRVETRPATRLGNQGGLPQLTRGIEVAITLDPAGLEDGGPWGLATVLERFLASLCALDSFVQLTLLGHRNGVERELYRWPPRPGQAPLV
jgi:type VI secretion system protein ImpG